MQDRIQDSFPIHNWLEILGRKKTGENRENAINVRFRNEFKHTKKIIPFFICRCSAYPKFSKTESDIS
jgi:hypothetical protein